MDFEKIMKKIDDIEKKLDLKGEEIDKETKRKLKLNVKVRKKLEEYGIGEEIDKLSTIMMIPIMSSVLEDGPEKFPVSLKSNMKAAIYTAICTLVVEGNLILKKKEV